MNRLVLSLLVALAFSTGCATMPTQYHGMEVAIEHLSAPEVQLIESRAVAKIRIDNETAEPVELVGGVHRIRINGKRIGKVMDGETVTIPAYSSVVRDVPLMLANLAVLRTISQTIETQEADYQLESRLTLNQQSGRRTVTLRRAGEISLEDLIPRLPQNTTSGQPLNVPVLKPATP
jgi:LEA14-like dessication related protein